MTPRIDLQERDDLRVTVAADSEVESALHQSQFGHERAEAGGDLNMTEVRMQDR